MILQGPAPVTITPSSATVQCEVQFDLTAHTFTIIYRDPAQQWAHSKSLTGNIPPGLLTTIENAVKTQIENNEGWGAGTSAIITP